MTLFAVAPSVHAQVTGTIAGRVQIFGSGDYVGNARISVKGTGHQVFTNPSGEYRVSGLPAGTVELEVFLTGLASQSATVTITPGQVASRDFMLYREGASEGQSITLDAFEVAAQREYNAEAIAINEQRFSGNLKNVVATDAYGEIAQGNVGEFLKHVPGVTIEFNGNSSSTTGIQVRGFNSNYTAVTMDGGSLASTVQNNTQNHARTFGLEQATINNFSRVEVVKLPTPENSANLLGGAVNLVSKSAFERPKAELRFSTYLSATTDSISLNKQPGPRDGYQHHVRPSANFTYTLPLRSNLGIVLTGSSTNNYNRVVNSVMLRRWTGNAAVPGATPDNPQLTGVRSMDSPNLSERNSLGLKVDWKPAERHLLSLSLQANTVSSFTSNHVVNYSPTVPVEWGQNFTVGRMGSGTLFQGGNAAAGTDYYQKQTGQTKAAFLRYEFTGDAWKATLSGSTSLSRSLARDRDRGFFSSYLATARAVRQVNFSGFSNHNASPGTITVLDASGAIVDYTNPDVFTIDSVSSMQRDNEDTVRELKGTLSRNVSFSGGSLELKAGGAYNALRRIVDYDRQEWNFVGPDGMANTADDRISNYLDSAYSTMNPGRAYPTVPYASPWKLYQLYQSTPNAFVQTPQQAASRIINAALRGTTLEEHISAGFLMADGRLLANRLRVITGVRYESTVNKGWGYRQDNDNVYQRNPDGSFVRDGAGIRVLKPEAMGSASASANPSAAALVYENRGIYNSRSYDGFYPSTHVTFNIMDNLILRVAHARTLGRPRLRDVVPHVSISVNENPQVDALGFINVPNVTLKPWEAENYDLSLEYYLPRNGIFSVGVFRKDISDFFGNFVTDADEALLDSIGLSRDYLGFRYTTRVNVGDARITGAEIAYSQSLGFLGNWARDLTAFTNYTRLQLKGSSIGNFADFVPETANLGLRASVKRLSMMGKWNYRGRQRRGAESVFPGASEYIRSRATVDVEIAYRLTSNLSIFATAVNITKAPYQWEVAGDLAPAWSSLTADYRQGAQLTLGMRGTF